MFRKLWLGNNYLCELPASVGELTSLQQLFLEDNRISSLPKELSMLPNLQRIYIDGNPMRQLDVHLQGLVRSSMSTGASMCHP